MKNPARPDSIVAYQDVGFVGNGGPDLLANIVFRALKVLPGVTGVIHHGEVVVIHPDELVILALNVGHFHVMGGWADVFKFLSCELKRMKTRELAG